MAPANSKPKAARGTRNAERKNGKASKQHPQVNEHDPLAHGRGGYSFKGKHPEKAKAWDNDEHNKSRKEARRVRRLIRSSQSAPAVRRKA